MSAGRAELTLVVPFSFVVRVARASTIWCVRLSVVCSLADSFLGLIPLSLAVVVFVVVGGVVVVVVFFVTYFIPIFHIFPILFIERQGDKRYQKLN